MPKVISIKKGDLKNSAEFTRVFNENRDSGTGVFL